MKKYLAEFIGTFSMVFCGTGAIIINEVTNGEVTHIGVAITFGLIVLAMIYSLGHISGAHINPSVTIGFALAKKFPWKEVFPYVVFQLAGGFLASIFLKLLFPENIFLGTTEPSGTVIQSFLLEIILTFFLMFVILHVSEGPKEQGILAGIAIASVVLLEAMFAGPITGASMNPARSIAPAVISGHVSYLWIYIVAPITGASIAVLAYGVIQKDLTD
jgi:aquaporin Z